MGEPCHTPALCRLVVDTKHTTFYGQPATAPGFAYKVHYYCSSPPLLPNLTRPPSSLVQLRLRAFQLPLNLMLPRLLLLLASSRLATALYHVLAATIPLQPASTESLSATRNMQIHLCYLLCHLQASRLLHYCYLLFAPMLTVLPFILFSDPVQARGCSGVQYTWA